MKHKPIERMRLYLLPGLGADTRIFSQLNSGNHVEIIPLKWVPRGKARTLAEYAEVLLESYPLEKPYALGGVSLGGILAHEWAKIDRPERLVLISSVISRVEMPPLLQWAGKYDIGRFLNKSILINIAKTGDRFVIKSKQGRQLFFDMLDKSDPEFMEFAAKAVLDWNPREWVKPDLRIHGTHDRVFPLKYIGKTETIPAGNHFMIYEKAREIQEVIENYFRTHPF